MHDKSDKILNQLAQNFASKVAQLEGEKAILQVEFNELQLQNQELQNKINEKREEDEEC